MNATEEREPMYYFKVPTGYKLKLDIFYACDLEEMTIILDQIKRQINDGRKTGGLGCARADYRWKIAKCKEPENLS